MIPLQKMNPVLEKRQVILFSWKGAYKPGRQLIWSWQRAWELSGRLR
jgi:hypothetical protein